MYLIIHDQNQIKIINNTLKLYIDKILLITEILSRKRKSTWIIVFKED